MIYQDNKTNTDRINPQGYYHYRTDLTLPNGKLLLNISVQLLNYKC